jgi:hypothetical protein
MSEYPTAEEELKTMTKRFWAQVKVTEKIIKERDEAWAQRDRLAEALRKAISWGDSASHHILNREDINWTYLEEAKEELQYLNPET